MYETEEKKEKKRKESYLKYLFVEWKNDIKYLI